MKVLSILTLILFIGLFSLFSCLLMAPLIRKIHNQGKNPEKTNPLWLRLSRSFSTELHVIKKTFELIPWGWIWRSLRSVLFFVILFTLLGYLFNFIYCPKSLGYLLGLNNNPSSYQWHFIATSNLVFRCIGLLLGLITVAIHTVDFKTLYHSSAGVTIRQTLLYLGIFSLIGYGVNLIINWPAISFQWGVIKRIDTTHLENYRLVRNIFIFTGLGFGAISALLNNLNKPAQPKASPIHSSTKDRSNLK